MIGDFFKGTCEVEDVLSMAITIKLFDKGTWSNLGNGLFLKLGTEEKRIKPIRWLYPNIKTVTWNHRVIAKRIKKEDELRFLQQPKKIQNR